MLISHLRATAPIAIVALASLLAAAACGDEPGPEPEPEPRCAESVDGGNIQLVDHTLWTETTPEDDPFVAFRPAELHCPPYARRPEDFAGRLTYTVESFACSYTTVQQPLLDDACAGRPFYVWLWHFSLTAPADSTAHLAVQIGDTLLWEASLPIPSASGLFTDTLALPERFPAGTPIYFHLRNHGANTYNLIELSLLPE